jgi:O-antigen/teichoic acid export membrane protein
VLGAAIQVLLPAIVVIVALRRMLPTLVLQPVLMGPRRAWNYATVSLILLLMQVSNVVDYQWDKLVLTRLIGSGSAGEYDIGSNLTQQGRALALLPVTFLLAGLAQLIIQESERAWRLYDFVVKATLTSSLAIFGALVLFSPVFVELWLGEEDSRIALAAQLLAVAMYANAVTAAPVFYLISQGHLRPVGWGAVVNIGLNAGMSLALTLWIGYRGALIGSIIANAGGSLFLLVWLRLRYRDMWRRSLGRPLVAAVICAGTAWVVGRGVSVSGWLELVLGVGVWVVFCLAVSLLCKAFEPRLLGRVGAGHTD